MIFWSARTCDSSVDLWDLLEVTTAWRAQPIYRNTGTCDSSVDLWDLLEVMTAWGAQPFYRNTGSCDSSIDLWDLLEVMTAWWTQPFIEILESAWEVQLSFIASYGGGSQRGPVKFKTFLKLCQLVGLSEFLELLKAVTAREVNWISWSTESNDSLRIPLL